MVSINRDRAQMLKNESIFWRASLAIQADVATTLVTLADYLNSIDHDVLFLFLYRIFLKMRSFYLDSE